MPSKKKLRKQRIVKNSNNEKNKLCLNSLIKMEPRNINQSLLQYSLREYPLVIAQGSSGSGKSLLGINVGLEKLCNKEVNKLYITRNPVPTGYSAGLFPGPPQEKMKIWCSAALNHISRQLSPQLLTFLLECNKIDLVPLEVLKGMDFNKSFVILEEAQECSLEQLKMISTRIGKRSTLYINGDVEQSNINIKGNAFGLFIDAIIAENERVENAMHEIHGYNNLEKWEELTIPIINFTDSDCQRSNICRKMLSILKNI
jgi:phosphate starvation-inducible PhoH-like protein